MGENGDVLLALDTKRADTCSKYIKRIEVIYKLASLMHQLLFVRNQSVSAGLLKYQPLCAEDSASPINYRIIL